MAHKKSFITGGIVNYSIENPMFLYLFIPLAAALLISIAAFARLKRAVSVGATNKHSALSVPRFAATTTLFFLCGSSVIFALCGISFGTRIVPIQESGKTVSLVFDISYSMEARDLPDGRSRLEGAADFALRLLDGIDDAYVSVVLTKGDAFTAIPETKDFQSVTSLLESLSPALITSEGSSPGKGLRAALAASTQNGAQAASRSGAARPYIILFTDGEETDSLLAPALDECARAAAGVAVVGFGARTESDVLTGDGVTKVKSALRAQNLEDIISEVNGSASDGAQLFFTDSTEENAAMRILEMINDAEDNLSVAYEARLIERYPLFILLSIVFFICAFVCREAVLPKKIPLIGLCVLFLFPSCSPAFRDGRAILEGRLAWDRGDYQSAIASFLTAETQAESRGDAVTKKYALFALAVSYLAQGELDIALSRFAEAYDGADDYLKFAVLYNSGIIASQNGAYADAVDFFKQALILNGESTDAKVNLELSQARLESMLLGQSRVTLDDQNDENEDEAFQSALYLSIQEEEKQQWKSSQQPESKSPLDY